MYFKVSAIGLLGVICSSCATPVADTKSPAAQMYTATETETQSNIVCRSDLVMQSIKSTDQNRVLIAAHRGAHNKHPENSLSSIIDAIDMQADVVEIDVRLSADGVPVLMHDASLDRTTDHEGPVSGKSWAELQKVKLRHGGSLTEETVPSLAMALALAQDRIILNLDMKVDEVEPILEVVQNHEAQRFVMYFNSDLAVLSQVREIDPSAVIMPLAQSADEAKFLADRFDLELVHLRDEYDSRQLAKRLDQAGTAGWINALGRIDGLLQQGSTSAADKLISNGADVIQTDQPGMLLELLTQRNLRPDYYQLNRETPCRVMGG